MDFSAFSHHGMRFYGFEEHVFITAAKNLWTCSGELGIQVEPGAEPIFLLFLIHQLDAVVGFFLL
jgi:hypothetical protein